MKILVIFTGGTIGSTVNADGRIATDGSARYALIDEYEKNDGKLNVFDTAEPYRILSENLNADNILSLVECVRTHLNNGYDGIIITHGTDTLQYTAAILQYVFGNAYLPIVLVSSDYVLTDTRACGHANFSAAAEAISKGFHGVFVAYRNKPGEPTYLHLGNRLQNGLTYSASVFSICGSEYGFFTETIFTPNSKFHTAEGEMPCIFREIPEKFTLISRPPIIRIRPYPGMTYPEIAKDTKVILFESYHSGTICIDDALKKFTEQAKSMHIPMYLTGLSAEGTEYETVDMYRQFSIIPLTNCSAISQYCKAWIAVSNQLNLQEIMEISVSGDHV